jgi:TPR repeat protein
MPFSPLLSSEFVIRTKAVIETPNDYRVKAETLRMFMQMKALAASGDAMAQFRLAQAYPKNSVPYFSWMQAAANQDFTSALLALSQIYVENANWQQAAANIVKIFASKDSFIKSEARALIESNPSLGAEVTRQMTKTSLGKSALGFFAYDAKAVAEQEDLECTEAPQP